LQQQAIVDSGMEAEAVAETASVGVSFSESPRTEVVLAPAPTGGAAVAKRVLDVVGAVVLGVVFAPLILTIIFLMRKGAGSVIYRHRRVGRGGQMFSCLKFRTMVPNADQVLRDLLESDPELRAEWIRDHKLHV
jgi:exopolysaccharide production protein ExoY